MNNLIFFAILILGQYSIAERVPPTEPVYEACPQIEVSNECSGRSSNCGTHLEDDTACLARNATKRRDYEGALNIYNRSGEMLGPSGQAAVRPTAPQLETCAIVQGEPDPACEQRNQQRQSDYQIQMAAYDQIILAQDQAVAAATEEQGLITRQEDAASARAAAEEAARQNKESNDKYKQASNLCAMAAIYQFISFVSPCPACNVPALYRSIAFAVFAALADSQADSNESSGYEACLTSKKLAATSGINCGDPPTPGSGYPQDQIADLEKTFSPDGKCIGAPAVCANLIKELPPGMKVKDALYALKNFDKNSRAYKVNKDGSVTTKDGKTYTAANFANEAAMMAAGMSAADAKALAAKFKSMEKEATTKSGGFGDTGGSSLAGGKSAAPNGDITNLEKKIEKRELASAEGLAKEFNGEMIGVAGDNIFKMVNRRYKLKVAQDNFIAPTP